MSGPEDEAPWREPAVGAYWDASHLSLSGVELLRGEIDGRIPMPPIAHLTGAKPTDGAVGASTFSMPATPWLLGSQGLIAGGTLAILADGPLARAVGSALPPQTRLVTALVTAELSLRFLGPVRSVPVAIWWRTARWCMRGGHSACRMCGSTMEAGD